jgi:hypothetical protein
MTFYLYIYTKYNLTCPIFLQLLLLIYILLFTTAEYASVSSLQTSGSYHQFGSLPNSQSPFHIQYLYASLEHPS